MHVIVFAHYIVNSSSLQYIILSSYIEKNIHQFHDTKLMHTTVKCMFSHVSIRTRGMNWDRRAKAEMLDLYIKGNNNIIIL